MNILDTNRKGGPYESIDQYMKKALTSNTCELEWIYGSHPRNSLNKTEFLRIMNYLKENYQFNGEKNELDIRLQYVKLKKSGLSNIRCTINGVQGIKKYCQTNSIIDIPSVSFIKKERFKDDKNPSLEFKQLINTDYNFRINLKNEQIIDDSDDEVIKFKDNLKEGLKYYRYKKRYSFLSTNKLFRIDLTAVKSNTYNPKRKTHNLAKNLIQSNILNEKEVYELEIEYIGYENKNDITAIEEFSKKVYSEWETERMSDEDYEKQLALTAYKPSTSFSPEGNFNAEEDESYSFMSDYKGISDEEEIEDVDVVVEEKPTMTTNWSKAAAVRGNLFDNIWMNYWYPHNQWLFWGILKNNKQILFDGVRENYTGEYEEAPVNENYVKYLVSPPFNEENSLEIQESYKEEFLENINKDGYDNTFCVPFRFITGLDETVTKESYYDYASMKKLPSWAPKGNNKLSKDKRFVDVVILKFNEVITNLLIVINEKNIIVSKRKCDSILEEYKTMTEQNTEHVRFLGPQPVSMGLEMINPDNPHSILQGYVVTEKADGIRAELFIDKGGEGYLITQKKEIIHTGCRFKGKDNFRSCILDGEYITKDKDGKKINLYMIFDIYYLDSGEYPNHPFTLPWISKKKDLPSRSSILHEFKTTISIVPIDLSSLKDGIYYNRWTKENKQISTKEMIRIGYKQYYEGPKILKKDKKDPTKFTNLNGMGKMSKKILELNKKNGYEYFIDGLIFMPMNYPVSSNNEEIVVDNIGVTWYQNYKWKPPEENTIDFRIRFVKEEIGNRKVNKITSMNKNKKTIKCQQVHLYVGYDIKKDLKTDFTWKVMGYDNRRNKEVLFDPPFEEDSIHICNIPMKKDKLICQKDKTEVQDGFIYEMKYEPNNPFGYQWIPLRIRDDKERPNDSNTADNVWNTIKFPVTEEMIKGNEEYKPTLIPIEKEKYSYYEENPDSDADISLRSFHNFIKDRLINSITSIGNKPISIMDTSIGRGGDIQKYLRSENPISFLLGLDISPDINKAAKRYYLLGKDKPKALFLQYNTGTLIKRGEGCVGDHIDRNKLMIDILYDRQKKLPKELRPLVPKFKGLCKQGFNLISSQFTIHYYFSDEITLRNYIQNISDNLKKGGYFIGTCYDGMKVFNKLKEMENGHFEMIDDFGNRVFSITKDYDMEDFEYKKDNIEKLFGNKINVYMNSIGQNIPEYLVNFEMFINIMKEYDLVLSKPKLNGVYKDYFDNDDMYYTDGFGGFEMIINKLNDQYLRDISIKEYYSNSLEILKENNKLLRELSGLNNWFIFQKV